jgi:two-component system, NarL family, response regulator EvgA
MSDRVLLVMDDAFELSTMAAALKMHGTNVIGEARKLSSALLLMRSMQPNVLLIDMHLSKEHSIEIANAIRKESPTIGVVMLVACADLRLLGELTCDIPLGAKVVIKKSMSSVSALCDVISESRIFSSESLVTWVNGNVSLPEKALENLMSNLTNVQIETLRLVADGLTNAEISRLRFVSEKSVEQVVSRIAMVLNVQPDRSKNMRVQLVGEYFKWIGAPRH